MTHQQLNEAYWYYVEIGGGGLEVVPSAAAKVWELCLYQYWPQAAPRPWGALLPMREAVEGLGESMTYAEAKAMAAELDESIDLGE
jgi:hypothetical protein